MSDDETITSGQAAGPQANRGGEPTQAFHTFLTALEDGRFHSDLSEALRRINADLHDHLLAYGGKKSKGAMNIKIDFVLEKGVWDITADFTTKTPKVPRDRTVLWSTPGNNFARDNPRQIDMFPRAITQTGDPTIRRV